MAINVISTYSRTFQLITFTNSLKFYSILNNLRPKTKQLVACHAARDIEDYVYACAPIKQSSVSFVQSTKTIE